MADTVVEPEEAPVSNSPENDAPAVDTAVVKKTRKIIRRKKRPARTQVDPSFVKSEPPPQTGTIFNVWYAKWSGGDRGDQQDLNTPAPGRCNIARDSGYTRADKVTGSFFCRKWPYSMPTYQLKYQEANLASYSLLRLRNMLQRTRVRIPAPPTNDTRPFQPERGLLRAR